MARLDEELVRSLAGFKAERAAISCYVGLDPAVVPNASALSSHVTSLVDMASRAVEEAPDGALRGDLERLERFLEDDLDRTAAHGIALFVSSADDLWQEVRLPGSVEDEVHVARSPVLSPLLRHLERAREVVLAAVGRDRGSIWVVRDGRALDAAELSRDGQSQHDQGGWSQARYARSRDKEALDHMRGVAEAISELVPQGSDRLLAVACLEEQRTTFEELLEAHVREALIGWIDFEAHAGADALLPPVERLLDEHLESERSALLSRWSEERGQGSGLASDTWEETLRAAADGRIECALVDGRTHVAFECPACGRGFLEAGRCELDSTPLEEAAGGALELVVRATLSQGGDVRALAETLPDAEIAALLRYAQPAPPEAT